jgi:hypoxanthine phosphoribosyltransferase
LKVNKDLSFDPTDCRILILEDLIDSGFTLSWIVRHLKSKNPASIRICCLLDKKECHVNYDVKIDYVGFDCPNIFVVGYGMDYNEHYRCLPFIGILKNNAVNVDKI